VILYRLDCSLVTILHNFDWKCSFRMLDLAAVSVTNLLSFSTAMLDLSVVHFMYWNRFFKVFV
jgi:hypothetical protein